MDCERVRNAFSEDPIALSPELEQHIGDCRECARLFRRGEELGRTLGVGNAQESFDLSATWSATERALNEERGLRASLRSQATGRRAAFVLGLLLLLAAHELLGHRQVAAAYRVGTASAVGLAVGQVALVVWMVLRALSITLARSPAALALTGLSLPIALALALPILAQGEVRPDGLIPAFWRCFAYGSTLALPIVAALWLLDRRDHHGRELGALIAADFGSSANLLLFLHCPSVERGHLILGHASIGLAGLFTLAAAWQLRARAERLPPKKRHPQ
jgi:hypothetical protein